MRGPRGRLITPGPRRRLLLLTCVTLAIAAALVLAEGVARLAGRGPVPLPYPSLEAFFWVRDARLGFRSRPEAQLVYHATGAVVTTGPFGERVTAQRQGSGPAVLFVGDSTTFGGELNDDVTGPAQVARRLPPELGARAINAGVRGYNTLQAARTAEEWLARVDVGVVVHLVCGNDYLENLHADQYRPACAPVGRLRGGAVTVLEVPPEKGPWGQPVGQDRPPAFGSGEWWVERVEARSALATVLGEVCLGRRRIDPAPWLAGGRWAEANGGTEVLRAFLGLLARTCAARGVPLVVAEYVTNNPALDSGLMPDGVVRGACEALGVRYVDLRPAFQAPPTTYYTVRRSGAYDVHWNEAATATFAEAITPTIVELLRSRSSPPAGH